MANEIILSREHTIFAVPETTPGTLVFPSTGHLVIPAGYGKLSQISSYTDSAEIVDSRSLMDQFQDGYPAGSWSLPMYMRPSGIAGSVPQGSEIFKALFGTQTINSGTSVVYTLAKSLPSLSLWAKYGDDVFFCSGAVVNTARMTVQRKGAVSWELGGSFSSMGWAGTDPLAVAVDGSPTPVATITVTDAKKYTVGAVVAVGTDDNGGVGYTVTAVNTSTNVLTLSPSVDTDQGAGLLVTPFLPAGTKIGSPLEARTFKVSFDNGVSYVSVKSLDWSYDNGVAYLEDEITDSFYPETYVEGSRRVSGNLSLVFRRDDLAYFYNGYQSDSTVDMRILCGDTAGARMQIDMDNVRLTVPEINPTAPTVEISMQYTALASSGEDEVSMTLN